jgi:hypothetical protein
MALDQSALLEVLDALMAADVGDRVRQAAETVYQALIEAELTDTIVPPCTNAATAARTCATGIAPERCRRRREIWSCGSRSCVPARSSRRCWSAAAGWTRRCSRW